MRDVDQGRVKATNVIGKLKYLEDTDKKDEYISVVKKLSGFNCLAFPHCLSSVRGDGYVIPRLTSQALEFAACSPSGEEENATVQLEWKLYQEHLLQEDGSIVIAFKHEDETKESRSIHIRTIYVSSHWLRITQNYNFFLSLSGQVYDGRHNKDLF